VKNAEGNDSPQSTRNALLACYHEWLKGTPLETEFQAVTIEIDHAEIDGADEARTLLAQDPKAARDAIRVATGNDA